MAVKYDVLYELSTELLARLSGRYDFTYFKLLPCEESPKDGMLGISRLALLFEQVGENERNAVELGKHKAIQYTAWLTLLTRIPTKMSMQSSGRFIKTFSGSVVSRDSKNDLRMPDELDISTDRREGETVEVRRPNLTELESQPSGYLIPSDFVELTRKFIGLEGEQKQRFMNACLSYQVALNLWAEYRALSLACLVISIEAMNKADHISCSETEKTCPYRTDISHRYRSFFSDYLGALINDKDVKLLNLVINLRGTIVHAVATGGLEVTAPLFPTEFQNDAVNRRLTELLDLRGRLEALTDAALLEWLKRQ